MKVPSYTSYGGNVICVPVPFSFNAPHYFHLGHWHFSYSHHCYIKILMLFSQQKSYIPSNRWGLDSWPSKIKVNISCAVHIILFVCTLYLGWLLPNITKSCNEYQQHSLRTICKYKFSGFKHGRRDDYIKFYVQKNHIKAFSPP